MLSAEEIVRLLELSPHPEGGFYRETYRSPLTIGPTALPKDLRGPRAVSTGIYFLLPRGSCSKFHRIQSDELWHHYSGDPLTLVEIDESGELREVSIGSNLVKGERPQHVVRAGRWFGAIPRDGDAGYTLVGATVSPGFDFEDFEMGARDDLLERYPDHAEWIRRLT